MNDKHSDEAKKYKLQLANIPVSAFGNWGKTPGTQLQQNKGQSGSVTLPP